MILIPRKYKSLQKSLLQTWQEGLQARSDTEPGLSHQGKALALGGARPARDRNTHHFLEVTPEGVAGRQWHNQGEAGNALKVGTGGAGLCSG